MSEKVDETENIFIRDNENRTMSKYVSIWAEIKDGPKSEMRRVIIRVEKEELKELLLELQDY